jgi:hypothetical protein
MPGKHASRKVRPAPQGKRGRPANRSGILVNTEYEDDETEFIMAMDRFKREKKRPFPSWSEVLTVLKSLGWKKSPPPVEGQKRAR